MIRNALHTPEIATTAICIGFGVCLLFAVFVFFQNSRSRKPPHEQNPTSEPPPKD